MRFGHFARYFSANSVPNGIRTRVLALKGCHTLQRMTAETLLFVREQSFSPQMRVTLLHSRSRSDYLKRSQKRPQQADARS